MASPNARRRQRSTRITVAVALIMIASLVVLGALVGGSSLLVAVSAVLAVLLGAAATKITHSELMQSRKDAARDRAEQAKAYSVLTDERTRESQKFADTMTERIAARQKLIHELEGELSLAQRKVAETTLKLGNESRRADQAEARLTAESGRLEDSETRAAEAIVLAAELEQQVTDLKVELAAWEDAAAMPVRKHA
ncbi:MULTISPECIES: hypothetical protein [unclassified Nocardioides]|uniref:hypothetical protein n=1 Tax=unclassified Nocardioides TaxID=2615069 RepID=UPI0006FCC196|nr:MULTISPECIES: hypothetical protein [unclassified Nocardioides]KQY50221.1 hypothetical protein ASD30_22155 [Nocardioides sp. Root140]KRF14917.1 hypothetical protein ASH02_11670 [Nocardioides sp. Soil796]